MVRETERVQQWLAGTHILWVHTDVLNSVAVQFARRLPNVDTIAIYGSRGSDRHRTIHPSTFASLSSFHSLTTLWLDNCNFRSFSDLQYIIRAMPKNSRLIWGQCSCSSIPKLMSPVDTMQIQRPYLTSIVVFNRCTPATIRLCLWLSGSTSTTSIIRSIHLPFPNNDEESWSGLESLVGAVGPSLTELRFAHYGASLHQ